MKKILLSAILLCTPIVAGADDQLLTLSAEEVTRVEEAVKAGLRDPDSAKFYNLIARGNAAMVTVCGEVNGKNAFGGYAGNIPFSVFLLPTEDVPTLGDTPLMLEAVEDICRSVRHGGTVAKAMAQPADPAYQDALLEQFRVTDSMCRDDTNDSAVAQAACDMRDLMGSEMQKAGLCFDESGWQHCN